MEVVILVGGICRPAKPASWWVWQDSCQVLGGRDCLAGGTWMACTKDGRLAFLTNVLEPEPDCSSIATSRGDLPLRFLKVIDSVYYFSFRFSME